MVTLRQEDELEKLKVIFTNVDQNKISDQYTVLEKLLWIFYFFNNFDAIFLVT